MANDIIWFDDNQHGVEGGAFVMKPFSTDAPHNRGNKLLQGGFIQSGVSPAVSDKFKAGHWDRDASPSGD